MIGGNVKDAIRFGFAVGRVRVLESRLLSRATIERLLDARDFVEQKRVLSETHLGRYLEGAETAEDVERALDASLEDLFQEFLEKANLPQAITRYFRLPYDYANLKAWLKAEVLGVALESPPSMLGTVAPEAFRGGELPEHLARVRDSLRESGEEAVDEERVETAVDEAMYADLGMQAKASGSRFLKGLADLMADLANGRVLLRARRLGWQQAKVREQLIESGTLPIDKLLDAYTRSEAELAGELLREPAFHETTVEDLTDFERFDVAADDAEVRYLKRARMIPTGPEPVVGYVMARQAEVKALRLLLTGKILGLPAEALRARLRELYS